ASSQLGDVATIHDDGGEPDAYVMQHPKRGEAYPAVTLSIAKRKGTNAIALTRAVEQRLEAVRGYTLPADLSVSLLIWLTLGHRESAVVLTAIPVTLALTLFVFYLYGYTLNRITLFALI